MTRLLAIKTFSAALLAFAPIGVSRGADAPAKPATKPAVDDAGVDLLEAARSGQVALEAEGTGDGRMTIKVTNRTNRRLKVVLPPGLVASGAAGQFGGMGGGGMGGGGMGGMGGGGMGGGGMGGMGGGGMGGMGGGMGGGGMGGMGGGGGGQNQRLTLPATQGLQMLANLIFTLVEPTETWNRASFMQGMGGMGGMGMGGGMGGMGGGMGGMGGGMGGGFRSVSPTDLPNSTLEANQTKSLATSIVSLNVPGPDGMTFPAKGDKLALGDVSQTQAGPNFQAALRRLARDKAPANVSQVALWAVAGMDWADIAYLAGTGANAQELALARQLVNDLDANRPAGDTGRLMIEVLAAPTSLGLAPLASQVSKALSGKTILGLAVEPSVPLRPAGPAVACKVSLAGTAAKPEATVSVAISDASGSAWAPAGKFSVPLPLDDAGRPKLDAFADSVAGELLKSLVGVNLVKSKAASKKDKDGYVLRLENNSPLMLNAIALSGVGAKPSEPARVLAGIALSPRRTMSLPASAEAVERFGLKQGVKVIALDLSGL